MKRLISLVVSIVLVLSLTACGEPVPTTPDFGSTTLMVFMLGEQQGALAEMEQAGIDLSKVSLAVCETTAVFAEQEPADEEADNTEETVTEGIPPVTFTRTLRTLAENGFVTDSEQTLATADNAQALGTFLTDTKARFPADHYGLIVIADGHGPLEGLGEKAAVAENALSLPETADTLKSSPFAAEQLDFIGFDAGLMSAVETASLLSPFARYLLASEEAMPSTGLDYTVLAQTARCDSLSLLTLLADGFEAAYNAYCNERGCDNIACTMTVTDLEKITAVTDAVNALFPAEGDAEATIAAARANSYVCGLTTTVWSGGDLVDATSLADAMPPSQEAAALTAALAEATVHHTATVPHASGLSLYLPFSGKDTVEERLAMYETFDALSPYAKCLAAFAAFLTGDAVTPADEVAAAPVSDNGSRFSLTLTDEQASHLADARLIIFQKTEERYFPMYESKAVTRDGNTLTADFDGNTLYIRDIFGHDTVSTFFFSEQTVGDITYYAVRFTATPADEDLPLETCTVPVSVDRRTGDVKAGDKLIIGSKDFTVADKRQPLSLDDMKSLTFDRGLPWFPAFCEDGTEVPMQEWSTTYSGGSYVSFATWYTPRAALSFEMLPPQTGEYEAVFELFDSQNNRYYSERLPFSGGGEIPAVLVTPEPIEMTWTSGDSVVLVDSNNVTVSLLKERDFDSEGYRFVIDNRNDFEISIKTDSLILNDTAFSENCTPFGRSYNTIPAHTVLYENEFFSFSGLETFLDLSKLSSMQFNLTINEGENDLLNVPCPLVYQQPIRITLGEETVLTDVKDLFGKPVMTYRDYTFPAKGVYAEEQVLVDEGGVKLTLIRVGATDENRDPSVLWRCDNATDEEVTVTLFGGVFGDVFIRESFSDITVPAGLSGFETTTFNVDIIDSADSLSLVFSLQRGEGEPTVVACPVDLKQAGEPPVLEEGDTVLLDEQGVRVTLVSHELDERFGDPQWKWQLVVQNNSGKDISLVQTSGTVAFHSCLVGDGQKTAVTASCYDKHLTDAPPVLHLAAGDFLETTTLFTLETPITLPTTP